MNSDSEDQEIGRDPWESVKREVRRNAGFGCVFCGCPVYHYEHIDDFAPEPHHDPARMTLLCPTHHEEKKKGLLPRETIRSRARQPILRERTSSRPIYVPTRFIDLAGNLIHGNDAAFAFGKSFYRLEFRDGGLVIDAEFYDEDGRLALQIKDSEYSMATKVWDVQFEGQEMTFRHRLRDPFLRITFNGPIVIIRGDLPLDTGGPRFKLSDDGITFGEYVEIGNCLFFPMNGLAIDVQRFPADGDFVSVEARNAELHKKMCNLGARGHAMFKGLSGPGFGRKVIRGASFDARGSFNIALQIVLVESVRDAELLKVVIEKYLQNLRRS